MMKANTQLPVHLNQTPVQVTGKLFVTALLVGLPELMQFLKNCQQVAQQRQHLRELSDDQLNDLGLTRQQAQRESRRGFFDLPQHMHAPTWLWVKHRNNKAQPPLKA